MRLLFIIILIGVFISGFAQKNELLKPIEGFEGGIPQGMISKRGFISIDSLRIKHGKHSLCWSWKGNSQLIFNTPIGYRKQHYISAEDKALADAHSDLKTNTILSPPRGFFLWIYNTKASQQRLRIQFGRDDKMDCEFDYQLNFKGWRTIAIGYDRGDMRGVPHEDMNRLTINAPATGSGTFYLDMLGLSVTTNPRTVGPNPQLPEIDQHPRLVAQYPHLLFEFSKYKPTLPLELLSEAYTNDFRKIEKQINDIYWPDYKGKDHPDSKLESIRKKYDSFNIYREGKHIYGAPLMNQNCIKDYFKELQPSDKEALKNTKRWRHDFNYLLRDISNLYYYTNNKTIKAELEKMFINLFDYGVDQGFDEGAGLGWLHHYSYVIREYGPAMFVMRDVLKKHQRLDKAHAICKWMYGFNQVYNESTVYKCDGRIAANADELQGFAMPKLMTAFLQEDSPEKIRDIKHYSSYFSKIYCGYANALDETFKPDGTIFHHAGHSFGYGGRAINGVVGAMYMLSGTSFAASEEAYNRIKKATETYMNQLFTNNMMAPKVFSNIRFSNYTLPEQFFAIPAILSLSANTYNKELAALFDDITSNIKDNPDIDFWKDKLANRRNNTDKYNYTGCTIYPYTNVGLYRQANNYLIAVRAHSKYVYPFESWGKSFFAYPLFIANGYLDVSYPKSIDSATPENGIWHNGYDWHRWPGVTSVSLPYDKMTTNPGQVRDEGGEYLFSDQAFSGGVSTSYGCGIYAFQFKGHDKFNLQGFTGKKSYFFIKDMVFCLGNQITSDLDYNVETTLFQNHMNSKDEITTVGNSSVSEFPYNLNTTISKPFWIIDNRNTGYYIQSIGSDSQLTIRRGTQTNPNKNGNKLVKGDFMATYIQHGEKPNKASYQYILVANATAEKMENLATSMYSKKQAFKVLRNDENAHVISIADENAIAYAVYAKEGAQFKNGIVQNVNKQSTFMIKTSGNELQLSVADPDLNIYEGQDDLLPDGSRCELSIYEREWFYWPSKSSKVQITLRGQWLIKEQLKEMETANNKKAQIIYSDKKQTIIEFECRDGLSAEVMLKK